MATETEETKRVDMTFSQMKQLVAEALADLSWDGVPHLTPGEMQHRTNLAIFNLRKLNTALGDATDIENETTP